MPLPEEIVSETVNALFHAANAARQRARAEEDAAWRETAIAPPVNGFRGDMPSIIIERFSRIREAQATLSCIDNLQYVLEGLIRLAGWQHEHGIALLELGVRNFRLKSDESLNRSLLTDDLPALRNYRKVQSGLLERVAIGMVKLPRDVVYVSEMLSVYAGVERYVAAELEFMDPAAHASSRTEPIRRSGWVRQVLTMCLVQNV